MEYLRDVLITLLVCSTSLAVIIIPTKYYQDKEKFMASNGLIQCQNIGTCGKHWTKPELCKN